MILSAPSCEDEVALLKKNAPVPANELVVIDITDEKLISDKDLDFLMSHLKLNWSDNDEDDRIRYAHKKYGNISVFRQMLLEKNICGNLPYVLRNGISEIYYNGHKNTRQWVRVSGGGVNGRWRNLL